MPLIPVCDSSMFYIDDGNGMPLVFLHGNPTSSYLWRKILPRIGTPGRRLAPDLIGMGQSGKPDCAYGFADHARYLDAWFDALDLHDVVLIGHDWGGALALDWAARHPGRVRGVAMMETIVRPFNWADFQGAGPARLQALRAAKTGERKVLDENFFIETALQATASTTLSDDDLKTYAMPYQTRESRRPLLAWPRALPIEGEPEDVVARVEAYDAWLLRSTEVPKLLLTFDGLAETLLVGAEAIAWCRTNIAGLTIENCGPAKHLAPEDQPAAIAHAIACWLDQHQLRLPRG